jgi:hypothetical protein
MRNHARAIIRTEIVESERALEPMIDDVERKRADRTEKREPEKPFELTADALDRIGMRSF